MIALSGYGQRRDLEASKRAGFAMHLVKPVDTGHLLAVLDGIAAADRINVT
jgi:CheY-like chemotaxis protein